MPQRAEHWHVTVWYPGFEDGREQKVFGTSTRRSIPPINRRRALSEMGHHSSTEMTGGRDREERVIRRYQVSDEHGAPLAIISWPMGASSRSGSDSGPAAWRYLPGTRLPHSEGRPAIDCPAGPPLDGGSSAACRPRTSRGSRRGGRSGPSRWPSSAQSVSYPKAYADAAICVIWLVAAAPVVVRIVVTLREEDPVLLPGNHPEVGIVPVSGDRVRHPADRLDG